MRLRGTMEPAGPLCNSPGPEPPGLEGARLLFLVQAKVDGPPARAVNFILTDHCGDGDLARVLSDVNHDTIFILFPLRIVPIGEVDDIHRRWAARDYKVDMQYLPKGLVTFDIVQIEYPECAHSTAVSVFGALVLLPGCGNGEPAPTGQSTGAGTSLAGRGTISMTESAGGIYLGHQTRHIYR